MLSVLDFLLDGYIVEYINYNLLLLIKRCVLVFRTSVHASFRPFEFPFWYPEHWSPAAGCRLVCSATNCYGALLSKRVNYQYNIDLGGQRVNKPTWVKSWSDRSQWVMNENVENTMFLYIIGQCLTLRLVYLNIKYSIILCFKRYHNKSFFLFQWFYFEFQQLYSQWHESKDSNIKPVTDKEM